MNENGLFRLKHPSRIYLETTTRCNLKCEMCVKQSSGDGIIEGNFEIDMVSSIDAALPNISSLILSGIGEPLLYPDIEKLILHVSQKMKNESYIGFQTNGMLVNRGKARSLINAGLNLVCISMDASTAETFKKMRDGGEITNAENAIILFREESLALKKKVRIGIEFVITKNNLHHLIPTLRIAAENGAEFAIVSHLIAYDEGMTSKAAFDRNTDRAVDLYEKTLKDSLKKGIDITRYFKTKWKFNHTTEEEKIIKAVEYMIAEATKKGIFMNLQSIMNRDSNIQTEIERVFKEAEIAANKLGIELFLPATAPKTSKRCDFIESGSLFISWNGDVHPCHFLWHKYQCYISGWEKFINPVSFGNLKYQDIYEIWNNPEYIKFRDTVSMYDYPLCSNCSFAPCDYIYSEKFEQDCYTNTIPCCDCQWCLGLFQCLR